MRIKLPQDIAKAVEFYYSKIELSSKDIRELFGCSKSSSQKLKEIARELMAKEEAFPFSASNVLTDVAYRAWGLDIEDLEKRLTKLKKHFGG